jgi:hypothetical protein
MHWRLISFDCKNPLNIWFSSNWLFQIIVSNLNIPLIHMLNPPQPFLSWRLNLVILQDVLPLAKSIGIFTFLSFSLF